MASLRNRPSVSVADRLKRHPLITAALLAASIIAGVAAFVGNLQKIVDWLKPFIDRPVVTAFSLSPNARGFRETKEPLFGASEKKYRTFGPVEKSGGKAASIFLVTISNPMKSDLILTGIRYDVSDIGGVRGGESGPLVSLAKYVHTIEHVQTPQSRSLVPPFRVSAGTAASLEIQIVSDSQEIGLGWLMNIVFIGNGVEFFTEEFQLYLPAASASSQAEEIKSSKEAQLLKPRAAKPLAAPDEVPTETLPDLMGDDEPDEVTDPNIQENSNGSTSLLERRLNLRIAPSDVTQCIFSEAGMSEAIKNLDALDRDVMYLRAGGSTVDEFMGKKTHTDPPILYSSLFQRSSAIKFLTMVKSQYRCNP